MIILGDSWKNVQCYVWYPNMTLDFPKPSVSVRCMRVAG